MSQNIKTVVRRAIARLCTTYRPTRHPNTMTDAEFDEYLWRTPLSGMRAIVAAAQRNLYQKEWGRDADPLKDDPNPGEFLYVTCLNTRITPFEVYRNHELVKSVADGLRHTVPACTGDLVTFVIIAPHHCDPDNFDTVLDATVDFAVFTHLEGTGTQVAHVWAQEGHSLPDDGLFLVTVKMP